MNKPRNLSKFYLEFLNMLRDSQIINMLCATPYLRNAYPELDKTEAKDILKYWKKTCNKRQKKKGGL